MTQGPVQDKTYVDPAVMADRLKAELIGSLKIDPTTKSWQNGANNLGNIPRWCLSWRGLI